MSYGLKIFNLVEDTGNEKTSGTIKVFYEAKQVDDLIRSLKVENKELQRKYNKAVIAANEKIKKQVDGNAEYWKNLCEKRTQMYLAEQAARAAVAEQLQKEIHKPFPYIEQVEKMRIALLRQMAKRAFFQARYLHGLPKLNDNVWNLYIKKCRQWNLFNSKADELEKKLFDVSEV